jgi:hypothetical protein
MSVTEWVIIGVVVVGAIIALFGWDRYRGGRKKSGADSDAEPTAEVFADPESGRRTRVWYNAKTGEREYRPE